MLIKSKYTIKELLESGVHFGHMKKYWNPKMQKYILCIENNIHIINLKKTIICIYKTLKILFKISSRNGQILFINTKSQTSDITKKAAIKCSQNYVDYRWLGGTLTNLITIILSVDNINYYNKILLHKNTNYTKKELLYFIKQKNKLDRNIGGIRKLKKLPDAIFIIDVKTHCIAVKEAKKLSIPIIGIVDTNSYPDNIDYIIPGNDDSRKAVILYSKLISETIILGLNFYK